MKCPRSGHYFINMIDFKNFGLLLDSIADEKGLPKEKVLESVEQALAAAYKKEFGKRGQNIHASLDIKTGNVEFWQTKLVVDESMLYSEEELEAMKEAGAPLGGEEEVAGEEKKLRFNEERHIMVGEAKKIQKDAKPGDEIKLKLETKTDYGRIAAQTAKQVILQKIREAERESVLSEFKAKEGELVSGVVQRVEGRAVFVDLGKTLGMLPAEEQVPGEFYRIGQRLRFFLLRVEDSPRGPLIYLSRAYPKFISKLFELEVPEIGTGAVEIKGITREAGSRSKVAVVSTEEGVDPVGSMVGQRGTRVSAVINELGGEKIDIVQWAEDPAAYIAHALSPARVLQVEIEEKNKAVAIVAEDQLSLAIGRDGQNVRLAAKLTGWKIDVRAPEGEEVLAQSSPEEA
ncbi:MAG: NusA antitermination factor [Parcubacteria group bacterium GW2011_GWA2_50_10]|uniref:Transcription termination/antitermination protein NusA n=1 Tax=Candidatus Yanofskybacteria bacterium GW2011_GWC1_48_11 TaxID=1619027 RepID=A0A837IPJ2_9BACT|nr:MAG: NusA antitermination factor [Candidatus Yanofskybacteria bacterium GW2011_GWC1_48_11]KKW03911.1 MAG: NusA antitermination factor [Parcubacteria group bacterium GW2011_GWB1_49_12]KKW08527.1 MAG: NusA antitermination factor [Parcubacteria group bacterium GW2011_GWA1_49_26]KKW14003.1 MAG: NusA antitermination factor [Parcubacteria group bacterium GW2011_GWA2_50_10]